MRGSQRSKLGQRPFLNTRFHRRAPIPNVWPSSKPCIDVRFLSRRGITIEPSSLFGELEFQSRYLFVTIRPMVLADYDSPGAILLP